MTRHARLGPSSSEIWLSCLGAPAEWAKVPPRKVGVAAHEGTLAHTLCEASLTIKGAVPWKVGQIFNVEGVPIEITPEMLTAVRLFAATANGISDTALWRMVESEVSLSWMWPASEPPEDVFGTLDFSACDGVTLYVLDFKYGRGKFVSVERNTQLLCYALGVLGRLERERPDLAATIENVCLMIIQPRAGGQPIRTWSLSIGELVYWGFSTLKPSVDKIANGGGPLNAGNHCFFCAAVSGCPAYRKMKQARSIASFPDYDPTKEDLDFEEPI